MSLPSDVLLYRKVTWRLIPLLFVCYIAAYLDRVNVGFAKLQMLSDLQWSDTIYGLGAGMFFLGYFLLEVPSNLILQRVGARRWIARIMITWGALSAATMLVRTPGWFYTLRFLLGMAEAGFFPGVILYLTTWYPAAHRARIVALFMMAIAVAGIIGSPVSGWILQQFHGVHGWAGWQWLFLLEGLPSVLLGFIVFFYLDDDLHAARWLTPDERNRLATALHQEEQHKTHLPLRQVFLHPRLLLLSLIYFCLSLGLYGVSFWLPQLIKNAGVAAPLHIGLLTAIPYTGAMVGMWWFGRRSDATGERRWHLATASLLGSGGLLLSTWPGLPLPAAIAAFTLGTSGILASFPLFWTLPTAFLSGTGAAAGIALINSLGGLAGFASPYAIAGLKEHFGTLTPGLIMLSSSSALAAALVVGFIPARLLTPKA